MDVKVVENVEPIELIGFINRKKKLHQKLLLDAIEEILGRNSKDFPAIRKLILDNTSDFSRSVVRVIFGDDFEGLIR